MGRSWRVHGFSNPGFDGVGVLLTIMAALSNKAGHYILALWFLSSSFLWPSYVIGQPIIFLSYGFFFYLYRSIAEEGTFFIR